jgi:hypothetical protein
MGHNARGRAISPAALFVESWNFRKMENRPLVTVFAVKRTFA